MVKLYRLILISKIFTRTQTIKFRIRKIYSKLITILNERVKDCVSRKLLEQLYSSQDLSVGKHLKTINILLWSIYEHK